MFSFNGTPFTSTAGLTKGGCVPHFWAKDWCQLQNEWMYHRMWLQNWCIQIEILWCLCSPHEWPATHFREMAWVPSKCFEESPKLSFCGTVLWDQQPSLERLCGTYAEPKQSIPDLCKPRDATIHSFQTLQILGQSTYLCAGVCLWFYRIVSLEMKW